MFAANNTVVAGVDGSLFADLSVFESETKTTTFSLGKLTRDIAALAKISRRNASVGALFGGFVAIEA